jgi:subtilisin family serine protease
MEQWKRMKERVQTRWLTGSRQDTERPRIKVAVLDTGVDTSHNLIKGAIKKKRITILPSYAKHDSNTKDFYGHGTHVAGLLLKMAPEAQLFIFKVASDSKIPAHHKIADVSRIFPHLVPKKSMALKVSLGYQACNSSWSRHHYNVFRHR